MNDNYGLPTKFVFHPSHMTDHYLFDMSDVNQDGVAALYEYNIDTCTTFGSKHQEFWTAERIAKNVESSEWIIDFVIEDAPTSPELEDLL